MRASAPGTTPEMFFAELHVPPDIAIWLSAVLFLLSALMVGWALTWTLKPWLAARRRRDRVLRRLPRSPGTVILEGEVVRLIGSPPSEGSTRGPENQDPFQLFKDALEVSQGPSLSPFELRLQSGECVRVDPAEDTIISQNTGHMAPFAGAAQMQLLELADGAKVRVHGEAVWQDDSAYPYRSEERVLVLKRSGTKQMCIEVGTEPLCGLSTWRYHTLAVVVLVCAAQALLVPYYFRLFHGETIWGTVVDLNASMNHDTSLEYRILVLLPDHTVASREVGGARFLSLAQGDAIAVRRPIGIRWWAQLGTEASAEWSRFTATVMLLVALTMVCVLGRTVPWNRDFGCGPGGTSLSRAARRHRT